MKVRKNSSKKSTRKSSRRRSCKRKSSRKDLTMTAKKSYNSLSTLRHNALDQIFNAKAKHVQNLISNFM